MSHSHLTYNPQAVRDVVPTHDTLIGLFERIHFFLQRLNIFNGVPLTNAATVLLGRIMAQLLSILALSTKAMRVKRFSEPIIFVMYFLG